MNYLTLFPAALIGILAQAAGLVKLPITQENHASWMRCLTDMKPGKSIVAVLAQDVTTIDKIVVSKGSRIYGMVSKDGAGAAFTRVVLPDGSMLDIEPFTIKGLLKEGE